MTRNRQTSVLNWLNLTQYPPFNYEKSCFAKWSTLVHKLEVGVQQPLRSQMRWWERHGLRQLRRKATEKTVPTWSCLWSGFRWEFCQPIGQKRVAQSLEMTLSSMRGVAKEACQILSADWDIGCDNILRVHIATFLAFALWLGRRSALVHLQWKWKLRVCQIKGSFYFGQITWRRCIRMNHIPEVKSTMAFMHEYSALSTWRALSFSTCSWKIRMWSMKDTTRSAAIGAPWSPAATKRGATLRGILHCAALSTNNSDQTSLSRATWSVTCNSGNPGIFLVHSTALKYQNYMKRLLIITKKGQKSITNLPKQ